MLKRNEENKLQFDALGMQIFIGELFEKCNSEHEVNWMEENIQNIVEMIAEERLDELED